MVDRKWRANWKERRRSRLKHVEHPEVKASMLVEEEILISAHGCCATCCWRASPPPAVLTHG
jgi:hypothetical protein